MLLKWYEVNVISQVTKWKGLWRGNLTLFVAFDWRFDEMLIKIFGYRKHPTLYPLPLPYPVPSAIIFWYLVLLHQVLFAPVLCTAKFFHCNDDRPK